MMSGLPDINSPTLLAGKHVLVLNWRDVQHSQAGGAEQYMHEISKRWVQNGVEVTWFTGRDDGQSPEDVIDGIRILRGGCRVNSVSLGTHLPRSVRFSSGLSSASW